MTPSQLVAVLGYDERPAVLPVPFPEELLDATMPVPASDTPAPPMRLRRLI